MTVRRSAMRATADAVSWDRSCSCVDPSARRHVAVIHDSGVNPNIFFVGGGEILSLTGRGTKLRAEARGPTAGAGVLREGQRAPSPPAIYRGSGGPR